MIRTSNRLLASKMVAYRMIGYGRNHLTVRAVKRSIDGALGPRGAWLLEPYDDLATSSGLETSTVKNVTDMARLAMKHDFQACVHAIGDRANREVLDIFEKQFLANPTKKDLRWRIEHAQHIHPDDVPRFGKLGVIASMQGVHCTSDAIYVLARLGEERARTGAYVWQDLMQTGALVTNGTDAPVENISPIASYYATVSRRLKDGSIFFHKQRMSRIEALRSYTIHAAKAAFEEDIKGTLTPGKLADVVVLSRNLMTCAEKDIPTTKVLYTILGGKIRYQAK
jgi:predicted amidohydrolase YtcJ